MCRAGAVVVSLCAHDRCDPVVQRAGCRGAPRARRRDSTDPRAERRHDRCSSAPRGRECSGAPRVGPVPPDGAGAVWRLPDQHPHLHRSDGRSGPRLRLHVLGGQPDQRVRLAGRALPRAGAGRRLGRRPRRVDCRVAGAQRLRRAGGRRLAGERAVAMGVGIDARAVGRVRHPHEERGRRDGQLRAVAAADARAHAWKTPGSWPG